MNELVSNIGIIYFFTEGFPHLFLNKKSTIFDFFVFFHIHQQIRHLETEKCNLPVLTKKWLPNRSHFFVLSLTEENR